MKQPPVVHVDATVVVAGRDQPADGCQFVNRGQYQTLHEVPDEQHGEDNQKRTGHNQTDTFGNCLIAFVVVLDDLGRTLLFAAEFRLFFFQIIVAPNDVEVFFADKVFVSGTDEPAEVFAQVDVFVQKFQILLVAENGRFLLFLNFAAVNDVKGIYEKDGREDEEDGDGINKFFVQAEKHLIFFPVFN